MLCSCSAQKRETGAIRPSIKYLQYFGFKQEPVVANFNVEKSDFTFQDAK